MKFWLSLVSVMEVDQMVPIAQYAEELGFGGITCADHLVMPTTIKSKYPYTPDGEVFWPETTPWPDPWVTLATMGANTTKIQMMTNIYLAALRDPFTAAKAVSTAAVFNEGRIACGVASGWIKEEYELAGVDFYTRGHRLDELLAVMRKLWTGEKVSHRGEFFNFDARMLPGPQTADTDLVRWRYQTGDPPRGAERRLAAFADDIGPDDRGRGPYPRPTQRRRPAAGQLHDLHSAGRAAHGQVYRRGEEDRYRRPRRHRPWDSHGVGVHQWTDPGDDFSQLEVKKKAMKRYAETYIAKYA